MDLQDARPLLQQQDRLPGPPESSFVDKMPPSLGRVGVTAAAVVGSTVGDRLGTSSEEDEDAVQFSNRSNSTSDRRPPILLLAAVYGLTEAASIAAFGVLVGNWVDRTPRLKVVKISLSLQNSSVMIAGLLLVVLLAYPDSLPIDSKTFVALTVLVSACGALAALGGLATNNVVERDWVIVISEQNLPGLLAELNSVMRRIDLSCKLLAPAFVGFLMSGVSPLISSLAIAVWNLFSVGVQASAFRLLVHTCTSAEKTIDGVVSRFRDCWVLV